jgi:hypothetical protein
MTTQNLTIQDFSLEMLKDFNIEIGIPEKVLILACKHYMAVSSMSTIDLVEELYHLSSQVSDSFSSSSQAMINDFNNQ